MLGVALAAADVGPSLRELIDAGRSEEAFQLAERELRAVESESGRDSEAWSDLFRDVVVEVNERDPEKLGALGHEIRSRVGRTLSLPISDLVFVRRGKIPKTTSGKVQRRALREQYLRGEIERLDPDR